jgi:hypothetical protein
MTSGITREDFEFLPIFCKHCGQQIPLNKKYFAVYERIGYPQYIKGHHACVPNPKFSEYLRLHNPMNNPESRKKVGDAQRGEKNHRYSKPAWNRGKKESPETIEKKRQAVLRYYAKIKGIEPKLDTAVVPKATVTDCKTCSKLSKAGNCNHYWLKITDPIENCEFYAGSKVETPVSIPEVVPEPIVVAKITASVEVHIPSTVSVPIEPVPVLTEEQKLQIAIQRLEAQRQEKIKAYKVETKKEQETSINHDKKNIVCVIEGKRIKICVKNTCKHYDFCHRVEPKKAKAVQNGEYSSRIKQLSSDYPAEQSAF